jgi:CRISPR/Cas system CSM-associated protein Csm3 (group 7 of RAMP superfamily)
MRKDLSVLHLARAVLEVETPLSISTGSPDGVFDTALVRDANGLPAIPGSSLAGVLRHLWTATFSEGSDAEMFGYQDGKGGRRSSLSVSWGALLDSHGRPAEGLLIGEERDRLEDPLYVEATKQIDSPIFRNRVRITGRGSAASTGKFDRAILLAGNRFAVELRCWTAAQVDVERWNRLLDLFSHPGLRLGGATRAGLGRMRCVTLHHGSFDMREVASVVAFQGLGVGLTNTAGLQPYKARSQHDKWIAGTLHLEPRSLWRIGQGDRSLVEDADKPADLLPVTEVSIDWAGGRGVATSQARLLIPAASIKGALAHRMAFHARRFAGCWAERQDPLSSASDAKPAAVEALFGDVKDQDDGRAGCLLIDDAFVPIDRKAVVKLTHNSIDRFTGGVRDRLLFEEESLFSGLGFDIPLTLDAGRLNQVSDVRRSLRAALDDLCQGRLAIGSRTTAGNGFFTGYLQGPLADWLYEES